MKRLFIALIALLAIVSCNKHEQPKVVDPINILPELIGENVEDVVIKFVEANYSLLSVYLNPEGKAAGFARLKTQDELVVAQSDTNKNVDAISTFITFDVSQAPSALSTSYYNYNNLIVNSYKGDFISATIENADGEQSVDNLDDLLYIIRRSDVADIEHCVAEYEAVYNGDDVNIAVELVELGVAWSDVVKPTTFLGLTFTK